MLWSLALTGILLVACCFDLKTFRIPNALSFAVIALFTVKAAALPEIAVWPGHILAGALMLGLGFLVFALGVIGGGDAKLMSAVALWFGVEALPSLIAATAIGGGILALTLLAVRHAANRRPAIVSSMDKTDGPRLLDHQAPIPYALPIASAALWLEWAVY